MSKMIVTMIPDRYKWVATDENGNIFIYMRKPYIDDTTYWLDSHDDDNYQGDTYFKVGMTPKPVKNWKKTCKRIEEVEYV